jgi:hypothetical protein
MDVEYLQLIGERILTELKPLVKIGLFAGAAYTLKTIYTICWWKTLRLTAVEKINPMPTKFEKDVIYMVAFPVRISKQTPNLCPFMVKMETWMRMHNIKYQIVDTNNTRSKRGNLPYMLLNGEEYSETQFMIEFLSRRNGLSLDEGLSAEQLAVRRAVIALVEQSTAWTAFVLAYCRHNEQFKKWCRLSHSKYFNDALFSKMISIVTPRANGHGYGHLTNDELAQTGKDDIRAISTLLGDKKFFFGDKPTMIDCALFAQLSQLAYVTFPYPHKELFRTECTNIVPYLDRVKAAFWPDWDERVDDSLFGDYKWRIFPF